MKKGINNLPNEFLYRLKNIYSLKDLEIIKIGFSTEYRKPSFRINTLKTNQNEILSILKNNGLNITKVDYLENCYFLENGREKDLWNLKIFSEGKIYMQQISSQIPVNLFNFINNDVILDTTASPGSKTSQISTIMQNKGKIIAVDNNSIRIDKLVYTLKKQGCKNVEIIKTDARNLNIILGEKLVSEGGKDTDINQYFDKILFDAPCSSEGRINFNSKKSYSNWNESNIKKYYKLSKQILEKIIPMLKQGGELIFSTCTLAPEENEAIVHFILCNYPELFIENIKIDSIYSRQGIKSFGKQIYKSEVIKSIRILPSNETEGFFIAKFKKNLN